jgi:GTPase SAR1 family protein
MGNALAHNAVPAAVELLGAEQIIREEKINSHIDAVMLEDVEQDKKVHLILMVGTQNSGKTGLLRQLKKLSGANSPDDYEEKLKTARLVEIDLMLKNNHRMKFIDVGAQRNERRKWIHQFQKCQSVIFVTSISEYDQVLYEDSSTHVLKEALFLFDETCNSRWFEQSNMIVFLNHEDLFKEKLLKAKIDLNVCFPEYDGGLNYMQKYDTMRTFNVV